MSIKVEWVAGRKKALARALAMDHAKRAGLSWFNLTETTQQALIRDCEDTVTDWIRMGVLATFNYDYRETEDPEVDPITGKNIDTDS